MVQPDKACFKIRRSIIIDGRSGSGSIVEETKVIAHLSLTGFDIVSDYVQLES
jgi:hypothetical protein